MKIKEIIKWIEEGDWYLVEMKGSHRQYKHAYKTWACDNRRSPE